MQVKVFRCMLPDDELTIPTEHNTDLTVFKGSFLECPGGLGRAVVKQGKIAFL